MPCKSCGSPTKHRYDCKTLAIRRGCRPKPLKHRLPDGRRITLEICEEWYRVAGCKIMAEAGQRIFHYLLSRAKDHPE